jgi:hypothetical protein
MSFSPDFKWHTFRNSGFRITKNIEEINSYFYDSSIKARVASRSVHIRGGSDETSKDLKKNPYSGFKNEVRKAVISLKKSPVRLEKLSTFHSKKPESRQNFNLNEDELQVKKFIDAIMSHEPSVFRKAGFTTERQNIDIASADKIIKEAKKIVKHGVRKKNPKTGLGGIIQDFWANHISKEQVIQWDIFEDNFLAYIKNYMATDIGVMSRVNWQKFIQKLFLKVSKETSYSFIWVSSPSFPKFHEKSQKTISLTDFSKAVQTLDMVFIMFSCIDETASAPISKQNDQVYTYACGCKYKGQWHERIRDGVGLLEMCSKEVYSGIFSEGKFHDFGTLTASDFSYKGFFRKGLPHGFGKMTYPNNSYFEGIFDKGVQMNGTVMFGDGACYNGEIVNSCFEGRGVLQMNNGEARAGMWHLGLLHGEGTFNCHDKVFKGVFIDGQLVSGKLNTSEFKFKGDFLDFQPHGQGEFKFQDGRVFFGNVKNGNFEGFGKLLDKNGEVYEGHFKDGVQDGYGKLLEKNGRSFFGMFCNGVPNGDGKFENFNSEILEYQGMVQEGMLEGEGSAKLSDGRLYSGHFSQNCITGKGKMTIGKFTYIGDFLNSQFHGIGELRFETSYYSGAWINNLPNGTGEAKDSFGNFYSGNFIKGVPTSKHKLSPDFLKVFLKLNVNYP